MSSLHQSVYNEAYSPETALALRLGSIFSFIGTGRACLSMGFSLLNAVFATVKHLLLLSTLSIYWDCIKLAYRSRLTFLPLKWELVLISLSHFSVLL